MAFPFQVKAVESGRHEACFGEKLHEGFEQFASVAELSEAMGRTEASSESLEGVANYIVVLRLNLPSL